MTIIRETYVERRQPAIRWGAVVAGGFAALGAALLLEMLVVGGELASTDVHRATWRDFGASAGAWSVLAIVIAMFMGGLIAGRLAHARDRGVSAVHGGVVWALVMVFGTLLAVWTVSHIEAASEPAAPVAAVPTYVEPGVGALGIDSDDLQRSMEPRMHGHAPSVAQINLALRDEIDDAIRTGKLDRAAITTALVERAMLSRGDAAAVAMYIDTHRTLAPDAIDPVAQARHDVGETLLWLALGMALGLAAAIGGGALGAPLPFHRRTRKTHTTLHGTPAAPATVVTDDVRRTTDDVF